ncbi:MAG: hypothetical protein ACK50J_18285 [Planctomyces sp.]
MPVKTITGIYHCFNYYVQAAFLNLMENNFELWSPFIVGHADIHHRLQFHGVRAGHTSATTSAVQGHGKPASEGVEA